MKIQEAPPLSSRSSQPGWLASHRRLRWTLLSSAIFITLIALGYTVENWRGKRAWAQYKHDSEARGLSLDWNAYIPPPVPDDQNFFKAPNMQDWFTGRGMRDLDRRLTWGNFQKGLSEHAPSAEVTVVPANARVAPESADLILQYNPPLFSLANQNQPAPVNTTQPARTSNQPAPHIKTQADALEQLQKQIQLKMDALGQPDPSLNLQDVIGIPVTPHNPPASQPLRVVIRADSVPSTGEIRQLFPMGRGWLFPPASDVLVTGSNTFRAPIAPLPYLPAADYLRWSDTFKDDFAAIAEALKRPYARMEGDYEHPVLIPIPNFVCIRTLAQTLALRAQCYLLLGEPEKALGELTLMNDLSRMMEGRPTGKPMTLIAAMINVAVKGLYVGIIADGFRLHAWKEPQMIALQAQLAQCDLLPPVHDALQFETISFGHIIESSSTRELTKLFCTDRKMNFGEKSLNPLFLYINLAPRGWLYQNATVGGDIHRLAFDSFDLTNHLVLPRTVDKQLQTTEKFLRHLSPYSPYSFLAIQYIPNFVHAIQTAAKNQTLVSEAFLACALERYHLAYGRYPETLDNLVPRFADKLPHDLIGGAPLKYRNDSAQFLLYSIGWNEKDDGGKPSWSGNSAVSADLAKYDWVWPNQENVTR